jgi:hypothetical protein
MDGTPTTIVGPSDGVYGVVATDDGQSVYYSTGDKIQKVSSDGGPASLVATIGDGTTLRGLALSGTTLVALDARAGIVALVDLTAPGPAVCGQRDSNGWAWKGTCTRLLVDNGSLLVDTVLTLGSVVLWADSPGIKRQDLSALSPNTGATWDGRAAFITALSLGGNRLFFASDDLPLQYAGSGMSPSSTGVIQMAPLGADGDTVLLVGGQMRPQAIASDGNRVFWSTGDCAIWSLPL